MLALIILIISVDLVFIWCINSPKISYGTFHFDKHKNKLFLADSILWDTGAMGSIIYENNKTKMRNRTLAGYSLVIDYSYKMQLTPFFYLNQFCLNDSLYIRNFIFGTAKNVPQTIANDGIGLIGMDVINQANWQIDFNHCKLNILPRTEIYKPQKHPTLVLAYNRKRKPQSQLDFSVCKFKNVLIDAGSNREFTLHKSDIEKINTQYKPIDTLTITSVGLFSKSAVNRNYYIYDSLQINGVLFRNVEIAEGNQRLIGFPFFKKFDHVFLDTKKKQFSFYREKL